MVDLESLQDMDVARSPLDLIGGTPLLELDAAVGSPRCTVLAKCEWFNPGGSVKDRPALAMILDAEQRGLLKPGGTIVEPTSGNTGVGLAMVAARRGYKCVFVMPDKMSDEKFALLRAYGAEVIGCPTAVAPEDPRSYYSVSARLRDEIPGAWMPSQYHNPANPAAHEATTGPEIWTQTAGRVTHFVAGAGTGGTISGVARYLKSQNPDVQVIAADPTGSVYSGGGGRAYLIEGVGEDFWPPNYDPSLIDSVVEVSDGDAFRVARDTARTEGLLVGGSSGMALAAAARVAETLPADAVVVVLLPDSGRSYLSRIFNDDWMVHHGFTVPTRVPSLTVGRFVKDAQLTLPDLVHTHPAETVQDALDIMALYGVSQLPVLTNEPPVVLTEVAGTVAASTLTHLVAQNPAASTDLVADHLEPTLGIIGTHEDITSSTDLDDTLLVLEDGRPVGVLCATDIPVKLGAS